MKYMTLVCMMCASLFILAGCGGGADVETDRPVAELKEEAATLTVEDLKEKAQAYQAAIADKMKELEPIQEKLKEIPLAQQLGDEAKSLQADITDLTKEAGELKERLQVYLDYLKEKGESVQQFMN
jgi:Skp family chaperone for outer membrane proteins